MSNVATQDDDEYKKPLTIIYDVNIEQSQQFGILFALAKQLEPYLLPPVLESGESMAGEIDKEVRLSAGNTFMTALRRIDHMLESETRFTPANADSAKKSISKVLKKQIQLLDAQKAAYEIAHRPSTVLRPTIYRITGGQFLAGYGNPNGDSFFYGVGATPEEAFLDFDKAFKEREADKAPIELAPESGELGGSLTANNEETGKPSGIDDDDAAPTTKRKRKK